MHMESLINMDLEMFPDITEMLEGVSVGDVVKVSGSFQVKELNEKRFTGSFEDKKGITITHEEAESEDDSGEDDPDEGSEDEEVTG